jgi:hypothetical protein
MTANQASPTHPVPRPVLHSEGLLSGELAEVGSGDRGVEAAGAAGRLGRLVAGIVAVAIAVVVVIAAGSADRPRGHDQIRARCFVQGGPAEMCD